MTTIPLQKAPFTRSKLLTFSNVKELKKFLHLKHINYTWEQKNDKNLTVSVLLVIILVHFNWKIPSYLVTSLQKLYTSLQCNKSVYLKNLFQL